MKQQVFMLRYMLRKAPGMVIGTLGFALLDGLLAVGVNVYLLKFVIDTIQSGVRYERILYVLAAVCFVQLASDYFGGMFSDWYLLKQKEKLERGLYQDIYRKAAQIDLACYDKPDYYNDFVLAGEAAQTRGIEMLETARLLLVEGIAVIGSASILAVADLVACAAVVVSVTLTLWFGRYLGKYRQEKQRKLSAMQRKSTYLESVFYTGEYAKEIRLTPAAGLLQSHYRKNARELEKEYRRHNKRIGLLSFGQSFLTGNLLVNFALVLWFGYRALIRKNLGLGDMAAMLAAVNMAVEALLYILGNLLVKMKEDSLYVEKLRTFLQYENQIKDGTQTADRGISGTVELKSVSFSYEKGGKQVLSDINMTIPAGSKVAIVGYNGAGKSTLMKLLLRLYDPDTGTVLIDGEDCRHYTKQSYRYLFSTVFQDFQIFAVTAAQNVAMAETYERESVRNAMRQSGIWEKFNSLPEKEKTKLSRELYADGVELSGGERQKLAIARAVYRNGVVGIYDEASSALDPIAEHELNEMLFQLTKDKTAIFVSHRLAMAKGADRIYMLENGKVIEEGTHNELLALHGKYWKMWSVQADWYH